MTPFFPLCNNLIWGNFDKMAATLNEAIEIDNLTHNYGGLIALDSVSLKCPEGAFFGLLGPNGSGKTTLFRILSTLIHPTSGTARIMGTDVTTAPDEVRKKIGVVFQQPALDNELTARENLNFHGALYGLRSRELKPRIDDLSKEFGIYDRLRDRVSKLSGGLQRKFDLVRSLLHKPVVLLLDEPTFGLDPVARHEFWQSISAFRSSERSTVFISTHLIDEAEACDVICILDKGKVVGLGRPGDLVNELGREALYLNTGEPLTLAIEIENRLSIRSKVIGQSILVPHPHPHTLLPELYEIYGDRITGATIRRTTLSDVFLEKTGHHLEYTQT